MKSFFTSSFLLILQPFITKIVAYFVLPIFTLKLSVQEYGQVELIITITIFFKTIISMSTTTSFWKFVSDTEQNQDIEEVIFNIWLIPISLGFIFLGLLLPFAWLDVSLMSLNDLWIYWLGEFCLISYGFLCLVIRHKFSAIKFIFINFLYVVVFIFSVYFFLQILDLHVRGVVYSYLFSSLSVGGISFLILKKSMKFKISIPLIKEIIVYSFPLMITNLVAVLMAFSDRLLIGTITGSANQVGLYAYGYKFGVLIKSLFIDVFFIVWNPIRWKIYKMKDGKTIFYTLSSMMSFLFPFIGLLFVILSFLLASILTKELKYYEGLIIVPIVTIAYVFYGQYYFSIMGLLFSSKTALISKIVMIVSVFSIGLNMLLIYNFGYIGSAIVSLVAYVSMYLIGGYFSRKHYPITYSWINDVLNIILSICYVYFAVTSSLEIYDLSLITLAFLGGFTILNISNIKFFVKNRNLIINALKDVY